MYFTDFSSEKEDITDKAKAVLISSQAMDDTKDYAKQFGETCKMFGKGDGYDERKYYHFKVSPDPADNVIPEISHQLAQELANELFPNHECVIATHNDTGVIHSHIIVNSVNFETGKKLHLNDKEYADCKDTANILAEKMGLTPMDWRTLTKEKRDRDKEGIGNNEPKLLSNAEMQISKRANLETASWKEALRIAIDEAKSHCYDRASFESYLKNNYGVEMPRNTGKTVSFRHPVVDKSIRGVKLGGDYTADSIDIALQKVNHALRINQERSTQDARLLTSEKAESIQQQPTIPIEIYAESNPATATTRDTISSSTTANPTTPKSTRPVRGYEPKTQDGNRKRHAPRSISDIGAELREIDDTIQSLTARNPKNHTADRAESASGQQETFIADDSIADSSKSNVDLRPDVAVKPRKKSINHDR